MMADSRKELSVVYHLCDTVFDSTLAAQPLYRYSYKLNRQYQRGSVNSMNFAETPTKS